MKKTLITLLALAGVAAADEVKPITLTATFNDEKTATFNLDDFKVEALTLVNTVNNTVLDSKAATENDIMPDRLRPDINVDSGNSWTLDFTVSNSGANDLTVNSITLSAFAFNGAGDVQQNNRNFLFTVSAGDTAIATDTNLYIAGERCNVYKF